MLLQYKTIKTHRKLICWQGKYQHGVHVHDKQFSHTLLEWVWKTEKISHLGTGKKQWQWYMRHSTTQPKVVSLGDILSTQTVLRENFIVQQPPPDEAPDGLI